LKKLFKLLLLFTTTLFALENNSYVGGVAVVEIGYFEQKPKVFFKAKRVKVIQEDGSYFAVIGIGLNEKVGKKHIVAVDDNKKLDFYFQVKSKKYKKSFIKLKTNKKVTLSKKDLPADLPLASTSIYFSFIMKKRLESMGEALWLKWPNDFYIQNLTDNLYIYHR
jgi:hypothetical protein